MGKVIKDFEPQILKILEFLDSSAENLPPRESEEPLKPFSDAGLGCFRHQLLLGGQRHSPGSSADGRHRV